MNSSKNDEKYLAKYPKICELIKLIAGDSIVSITDIFSVIAKKCGDNLFVHNSNKLLDSLEHKLALTIGEYNSPEVVMIAKQRAYANVIGVQLKNLYEIPNLILQYAQNGELNLFLDNESSIQCENTDDILLTKLANNKHSGDLINEFSILSGAELINYKKLQLQLLNIIYCSRYSVFFDQLLDEFNKRKFDNVLEKTFASLYQLAQDIFRFKDSPIAGKLNEHLNLAQKIITFKSSIVRCLPIKITPEIIEVFNEVLNLDPDAIKKVLVDGLVTIKEYASRAAVYNTNLDTNCLTEIASIPQNSELTSKFGVPILELRGQRVNLLMHVVFSDPNWKASGSSNNRLELIAANANHPELEYQRQHRSRFFNRSTENIDQEYAHQISTSFFDSSSGDMEYKPKVGSVVHLFNGVNPLQICKTVWDTKGASSIYRVSDASPFTTGKNAQREVVVALEKISPVTDDQGLKSLKKDEVGELVHPTALLAIVDDQNPQIPEQTIIQAKAWGVPIVLMRAEDYPIIELTYSPQAFYEKQAAIINR